MSTNDIIQLAGVILALTMAVIWIIRRIRNKSTQCNCGCNGCPIAENCNKPKDKTAKKHSDKKSQ